MHRFLLVPISLFVFSSSLHCQTGRPDISGDWQNGPPENPNPVIYHVTQQGDNLTSDDATYGHAVGYFSSAHQIVMKWSSATWTASVGSDQMSWNNNSVWWRRGRIVVLSASADVNAGQANGSTNPDCYPAGGAQCSWLVIHGIGPGGPDGAFIPVDTPSMGHYGDRYQASYSGPLGSGFCQSRLGGSFDCNHWAIFEQMMFFNEPNGTQGLKILFKNWASKYQTATIAIRFWQWIPDSH